MFRTIALAVACAAVPLTLCVPAMAGVPSDVRDLVGARAAGAETALESRGYVHIKTRKDFDTAWSYWWNGGRKLCLMVGTSNGRYDSIDTTTAGDCNQKDGSGAALAIAAAALIGAAVLAHNAHDHAEKAHSADERSEADFDAGFRDGQYHHPYSPRDRSDAYASGYEAGLRERDNSSPHRNDRPAYAAGYGNDPVEFGDLKGARAAGADTAMTDRGFDNVDGFKSGYSSYTIWYNRATRQCVQMAVANGVVDSILDIHTNPKCR